MSSPARFAVGRLQAEAELRPLLWALWDVLDREGFRVQTYLSRACYEPLDAATSITGLCPRHLDSWLMDPDRVRRIFSRTARRSDLSILWGDLASATPHELSRCDVLAGWLKMPVLGVLDVTQLRQCAWPARPRELTGLLLDGISGDGDYAYWKTTLEAFWNLPVFGALGSCAALRGQVRQLTAGQEPPRELCRLLGQDFLRYSSPVKIAALAQQAQLTQCECGEANAVNAVEAVAESFYVSAEAVEPSRPRIAVAYDDAFHCYFPDVLEECELAGAEVVDFSPLRDESLPADTDLVYLGCGDPLRFAAQLAANTCLQSALREHVCAGRRIYAEGGGMAYLCREILLPDGAAIPMLGILPSAVQFNTDARRPVPIEIPFHAKSWLGEAGQFLRGYRSDRWQFTSLERAHLLAVGADSRPEIIARHQAIGSRVHLHFAALPQLLRNLLRPCPAALGWAAR